MLCRPAMEFGVTDHIWTNVELLQATVQPSDAPPLPRPVHPTTSMDWPYTITPRVIQGGKMSKSLQLTKWLRMVGRKLYSLNDNCAIQDFVLLRCRDDG